MLTFHSTVPDSLTLSVHLSGKLLGILYTIIWGVSPHWYSCTHGLPLKLELGHDGIFCCEKNLMIHTDLSRGCITEDSASLVDLRGDFGSSDPKHYPWKPWFILVRKYDLPRFQLIPS